MLKKSIAVVFAIALAMTATVAGAQECSIAVYADAAGTTSSLDFEVDALGSPFSMYVVMFLQDTVNAAAYKLVLDGYNDGAPLAESVQADTDNPEGWRVAGPNGAGLFIDETGGTNVALGECVFGYGGVPVLVTKYNMYAYPQWPGGNARLEPNVDQLPGFPAYSTCTNELKGCDLGPDLVIRNIVPNENTSFSSIKSLYN
jgi:hypothetical protein